MRVKVVLDERAGRAEIVDVRYGEKLADGFTFAPVPLARLNAGFNRPFAEVKRNAEFLADLWNKNADHEVDAATADRQGIALDNHGVLYLRHLLGRFSFKTIADLEAFLRFRANLIPNTFFQSWARDYEPATAKRVEELYQAYTHDIYTDPAADGNTQSTPA